MPPRLHSGAAIDRPEETHLTLPPIPEFVWQQPQEIHLTNLPNTLTNETHKNTHIPEFKQRNDVEAQTLPIKKPHLKYPDPIRNHSRKNKLGTHQYNAPMTPRNNKMKSNEMKLTQQPMTTEMTTFPLPKLQLHKLKNDLWGMILPMNSTCHYPPQLS